MPIIPFNTLSFDLYKKLYHILFNAITDALETLPKDSPAAQILMEAQQDTEEIYINATGSPLEQEERARLSVCPSAQSETASSRQLAGKKPQIPIDNPFSSR